MSEPQPLHSEVSSQPFFVRVHPVPTVADVVLRSLSVAGVVFGFCILAQWLVYGKLLDQEGIRYMTPVIAGVITGGVTFRMFMMERTQALAFTERFRAIAEAHHHIRNALQSLSYQRYLTDDQHAANRLLDAVNRIQWVLNEVFPRLEPGGRRGEPPRQRHQG